MSKIINFIGNIFGLNPNAPDDSHRLTAILEGTSDLVSTSTPDGRLTYLNQAGIKMLGWEGIKNIRSKRIPDVHPEWARTVVFEQGIPAAIEKGIWQGETAVLRSDGTEIPVSQVILSHRSPQGKLEYLSTLMRDISQIKEVEENLRMTRFALDNAPDEVLLIDDSGHIRYANHTASQRLGYTPEEMLSLSIYDINPFLTPEIRQKNREKLRRGAISALQSSHCTKAGKIYPVESTGKRLKFEGREFVVTFVRDISERQRIQEDLKSSEANLRALVDSSSDCIITIDLDRIITDCNPAFLDKFGFNRQEVVGKSTRIIHLNDESFQNFGREIYPLVRKLGSWRGEMNHLRKDGSVFTMETSVSAQKDDEGIIRGYVAIMRDVSARKKAEEALRKSEEKFAKAFRASPFLVSISTLEEGRVIDVNAAFTQVTGYTREEALGRGRNEVNLWADFKQRDALINILKTQGSVQGVEADIVRKDKTQRKCLWSAEAIELEGEQCFIAVVVDITERKRLERQLLHSQKMDAVSSLAGGLAHDFNNLLQAISGYAQILAGKSGEDLSNQKYISRIQDSAETAAKLVQEITTFSRKEDPPLRVVDINHEIQETLAWLSQTIPKMIKLRTELAPDLWLIKADSISLEQIIINLGTNARDAMPDGGEMFISTKNLTLSTSNRDTHPDIAQGNYILLTVGDTGRGMEKEVLEKVFEPFFTTKEVGKGKGLGLSTVYGIIESHGGQIKCSSAPGKGTIFRIYLPAVTDDRPESREKGQLQLSRSAGQETILLVDDEPGVREVAQEILDECGFQVLQASSGEEALDIYRDQGDDIDLVVMDIGMPGMGGRKALAELLKLDPQAKVVIATGYVLEGAVKQSVDSGAKAYIGKPYRLTDLVETVRGVLDQGQDH